MSINIGDNFKYLGKKFLDDRESFDTLAEMKQCNDVPVGFITICREDGKRYEYSNSVDDDPITGKWIEFKVGADISEDELNIYIENFIEENIEEILNSMDIDLNQDCSYVGEEEPEDEDKIWFDPTSGEGTTDLDYNNHVIDELFACIRTLQDQVAKLQADVEYIKLNGGGIPPQEPDGDDEEISDALVMEDGNFFLLEDGGFMLLENAVEVIKKSVMLLEDGAQMLLENGANMLLE
jgi:hypothetical protein